MSHPLDSARERLKRADENIKQLNVEVAAFLSQWPSFKFFCGNPGISDKQQEMLKKYREIALNRSVDPRISVLAGEVIHHMRSAFDHVVWQLSSLEHRLGKSGTKIEFPVIDVAPTHTPTCAIPGVNVNKLCLYCRKIHGVTSQTARARIEQLQPYLTMGVNAGRNPLWLIHDFDRKDKHRDLILSMYSISLAPFRRVHSHVWREHYPWETTPRRVIPLYTEKVEDGGDVALQIAFRELSEREDKPIVPTLQYLLNFARDSVESFSGEFPGF
jgi:hypothetical protein